MGLPTLRAQLLGLLGLTGIAQVELAIHMPSPTALTGPPCELGAHKTLNTTVAYNEEATILIIDITVLRDMMTTDTLFVILREVILPIGQLEVAVMGRVRPKHPLCKPDLDGSISPCIKPSTTVNLLYGQIILAKTLYEPLTHLIGGHGRHNDLIHTDTLPQNFRPLQLYWIPTYPLPPQGV